MDESSRDGDEILTTGNSHHSVSFLVEKNEEESELRMVFWSPQRRFWHSVISSKKFDALMGMVISINLILMIMEADNRAGCYPESCQPPEALSWSNRALLGIYTLEAAVRLYVERENFCQDRWNVADVLIVVFGYLDEVIAVAAAGLLPSMQMLPMLRLMRVARMVRAASLLRIFPELYVMVRGFLGAMRAMVWGLVLIILLLVFWSLICVEVVHPLNIDQISEQRRSDPDAEVNQFCEEAFQTVWNAAMVLFQTLVAGDSFGQCLMPIIAYSKLTFGIFSMALMTMALGLMNLILAVIVDHATIAREGDKQERLKAKKKQEEDAFEEWKRVIKEMDEDGNGQISYDELLRGYETPDVRQTLNVMGLMRGDLDDLFSLLDRDKSGTLNYREFIDSFLKAQSQDPRIYSMMTRLRGEATEKAVHAVLDHLKRNEGSDVKRCAAPLGLGGVTLELAGDAEAMRPPLECAGEFAARRASAPAVTGRAPEAASLKADFEAINLSIQKEFEVLTRRLEACTAAVLDHQQALSMEAPKAAAFLHEPSKPTLPSPPAGMPQRAHSAEPPGMRVYQADRGRRTLGLLQLQQSMVGSTSRDSLASTRTSASGSDRQLPAAELSAAYARPMADAAGGEQSGRTAGCYAVLRRE